MASALAAELLVGIVHNNNGYSAPAYLDSSQGSKVTSKETDSKGNEVEEDEHSGGLGVLPHQIRGWLSTYNQTLLIGKPFKCCPACGSSVINAYIQRRDDFITDVCIT